MNKLAVGILSVLLLSACSSDYQKKSFGVGYDEMRLSNNSYVVEYNSAQYSDQATNTKYAYRRAAELTKQNGYKYFKIVKTTDTTHVYKTPIVATTKTSAKGINNHAHDSFGKNDYTISRNIMNDTSTTVTGGETIRKPGISLVITMLNNNENDCYDADVILSNFVEKSDS